MAKGAQAGTRNHGCRSEDKASAHGMCDCNPNKPMFDYFASVLAVTCQNGLKLNILCLCIQKHFGIICCCWRCPLYFYSETSSTSCQKLACLLRLEAAVDTFSLMGSAA